MMEFLCHWERKDCMQQGHLRSLTLPGSFSENLTQMAQILGFCMGPHRLPVEAAGSCQSLAVSHVPRSGLVCCRSAVSLGVGSS